MSNVIATGISSKLASAAKKSARVNLGVLYVNNVAELKTTLPTEAGQICHMTEYNANTEVGGGMLIWDATNTSTADDVITFQVTGNTTGRWVRNWDVLTPELAGMVGDNATNNDTAIARLIAFAKIDNTPVHWERKRYLTGATNIVDFHSCTHYGTATINRNGNLWHITPQGVQENVLHVSSSGDTTNDGMLATTPINISRAIAILKKYADKANDGVWRIQLAAGTITFNGIRMDDMPLFRNPLEVWGANVALTATPTTVWDGTTSTTAYAMRQDGGVAAVANWHFKNIKFVNWMFGTGNNGAILIWAQGNVLCENIHCDNMGTGIWTRHGYTRITHGRITNVDTYGIGIQYGASGNVGDLSGGGVYIRGRVGGEAVGVAIGRNTTVYVQGCDIDHTHTHINLTRLSRMRTQGNTFGANYNVACVWNDTNSAWTPANDGGATQDIYPTLSEDKPAYRCESGAIHLKIDRWGQRSIHAVSDGQLITFTNTTQTQLSTLNSTFTPFRLPAWFLYSPTFRLDVEIGIAISTGGGGTLALHGGGSASSNKLAEIVIPNVAEFTRGLIKMSVVQAAGVSTARYSVYFPAANIVSEMNTTPSLNTATLRDNSELDLVYRLYWTSNNTNQVEVFNMRTYVES
jgi:hypothetical protein